MESADLWDDLLVKVHVELVSLLWDTLGGATPSASSFLLKWDFRPTLQTWQKSGSTWA